MSNAALIVCCIAYVVWPADVIPELFLGPVFGLPDDLIVCLIAARRFFRSNKGDTQ